MKSYKTVYKIISNARNFHQDSSGTALSETALVLPVLILLGLFLLEFAIIFKAYATVTIGIRDGARYLARTQNPADTTAQARARTLAVAGSIDGSTPLLSGWTVSDVTAQVIGVANPINLATGSRTYRGGNPLYIVRISTQYSLSNAQLLGGFGFPTPTITVSHEERATGG